MNAALLILVLGDSISLGYYKYLPAEHPPENGQSTRYMLAHLDQWAPPSKHWPVIVFNCGLHDVSRLTPPDEYVANLREIATRLRPRCDRLYFCSTTPGRPGCQRCQPETVDLYNCGALGLMNQLNVPVIDLYGAAMSHREWWISEANMHYTDSGYRQMAAVIRKTIDAGQSTLPAYRAR